MGTGMAACTAALLAWSSTGAWAPTPAHAVPVVGADSLQDSATAMTHNLQITLARGNRNADGTPPTGKVDGVMIELQQLAGIDPNSQGDLAKIHGTSLEAIAQQWEKSRTFRAATDANGTVLFEDLPRGIFLVVSEAPSPQHRNINSFLVAVPFQVSEEEGTAPAGVIVAKPRSTTPSTPPSPPTTPRDTPPTPTTPRTPGTTVKAPPPPTEPSEPGTPGTTVKAPPPPGAPATPLPPGLAMTGVQVIGIVFAGLALIGAGVITVTASARRNKKD
ncbi:surface anchored protein [Corynebacterium sp.]|uniref:surface anchored protein n=1 Tax=Corynebacterium sp. TaxID=1720 RepID=UPI0026DB49DB|nr:surface anchored protein [Corynebacterium sp.]MDO5032435.1 surface anchored protein [Corynebacterium sp.]